MAAQIGPVEWRLASEVLGGEASHFTPWLGDNLHILGAALGIDGLELVSTEADISGKRLDVLAAVGVESDGETVGVAIENQYGISRHDHLGQLVTYVAGVSASYDRVLGVWLVDEVHAAHEAAIEHLNRETTDRLGFVLARPRFVELAPSQFAVDFDVLVRPNEFIRNERRKTAAAPESERGRFLGEVLEIARPQLKELGFRSVSNPQGNYSADASWGSSKWRVNIRAGDATDGFRAFLYVDGWRDQAENENLLGEFLVYEDLLRAELRSPHVLEPFGHRSTALATRAAFARCDWPGVGFTTAPLEAAQRLIEFGAGVAAAVRAAGHQ